ncbi:hypothetical protein HELRODRAFT_173596 [Helobdella robusta]|uniref:Methyltransferase FkbM domain-containing protein n=1 Tax=Helobdella robusta TaxID=6412 RepID=T1F702_HELRO|nr:hypothetical protein HELRODRAFT_173596 [Helobdella robusta]ESO03310.1 hypothetical protein HELRODRAFT_173596 [Helobdella robusta]
MVKFLKASNACFLLVVVTLCLTIYSYNFSSYYEKICVDESTSVAKNLGFSSFSKKIRHQFDKLTKNKVNSKNPNLIAYLKNIIRPPNDNKLKKWNFMVKTPQAEEIDNILKKKNGFFVEAGGFDGETASNTLFLEVERGWTGLLIEPDPYFYTQLVGKNRNVWSINACISPFNYTSKLYLQESFGQLGRLHEYKSTEFITEVPCFPLESMLLALERKSVDFLSLDVEGDEVPILKSINFDEIDIKTLAVEYKHGNPKEYLEVMEKNNYNMTRAIKYERPEIHLYVEDYIFVKKINLH